MPAASHVEKDGHVHATRSGWCSGATRRSSRRATRARSCGSCTTCSSACRRTTRAPTHARDWPIREPDLGLRASTARTASPTSRPCMREINGYDVATGRAAARLRRAQGRRLDRLRLLDLLAASSPTASTRPGAATPATSTRPAAAVSPEWGWAWPANRRMLYNARQRRPGGQAVVGAQEATSGGTASEWTGYDVPDFPVDKPPDYRRRRRRRGHGRDRRRRPVHDDGRRPGVAVRADRAARRPDADALRAARVAGRQPALPGRPRTTRRRCAGRAATTRTPSPATRATRTWRRRSGSPSTTPPAAMTRWLPWLAELQPEMFAEIDPVLAARARDRGRRLDDDRLAARGDRGARARDRAHAAAEDRPRDRPPDRAAVALGLRRARHRATRRTT